MQSEDFSILKTSQSEDFSILKIFQSEKQLDMKESNAGKKKTLQSADLQSQT